MDSIKEQLEKFYKKSTVKNYISNYNKLMKDVFDNDEEKIKNIELLENYFIEKDKKSVIPIYLNSFIKIIRFNKNLSLDVVNQYDKLLLKYPRNQKIEKKDFKLSDGEKLYKEWTTKMKNKKYHTITNLTKYIFLDILINYQPLRMKEFLGLRIEGKTINNNNFNVVRIGKGELVLLKRTIKLNKRTCNILRLIRKNFPDYSWLIPNQNDIKSPMCQPSFTVFCQRLIGCSLSDYRKMYTKKKVIENDNSILKALGLEKKYNGYKKIMDFLSKDNI